MPMVGLPTVVVLVLVSVVASVFATRAFMAPQISEQTTEASEAQEQIEVLTKRLETTIRESAEREEQLRKELEAAQETSKGKEEKKDAPTAGGVSSPWLEEGFSTGDSTLDGEVKAFCDARSDRSMDRETAAFEVFKGVAWSDYVERDNAQKPTGDNWRVEYARQYYENDCTGNCYEFAAFVMYCLQYMGYPDAMAEAVVLELQGGDWGDHGLVFVTNAQGDSCLCDTSRGVDGWMLPSGAYNYEIKTF